MKETPSSPEEALFEEAIKLASANERAAFVERCCGANHELRATLELLLEGHFEGEGFLAEIPNKDGAVPIEVSGRYVLIEKIGEGGFGEVWSAEQKEPVKRRVALKILKRGMDTRQVITRFEGERQALALMDHPNIAKIFDAGATTDGRPFFVMELVRGKKITEHCREHRLATRERLKLFILVCQAIQHAHQKGIIHRDIKPSNVLVALQEGVAAPRVIDFGIAKATQQGLTEETIHTQVQQLLGTPAYISPEQALVTSQDIDTRSDIYSLGVLLYKLLTGRPPFDNQELLTAGIDEMRRIIREVEPKRPSTRQRGAAISEDLDWIVMKCLEKDRDRRYQTANGVAMDVQRHLDHEPIVARPPSRLYRISKLVRRNPVVASLGFLLFCVVAGALVTGVAMHVRLARAKDESDRVNRRLSEAVRLFESDKMESLAAEGRLAQPMAWLAARLRKDPTDRSAATRLIEMLSKHSFALPVFPALRHEGKVHSAEFAPDGSEIMTGCEDGTVRFWDVKDGHFRRAITNAMASAMARYVRRGTRLVVTGHEGVARVYDPKKEELIFEVPGLRDARHACMDAGNGDWLLVQDRTNVITRWDLENGTPLKPEIRVDGVIKGTAYSEATRILAVLCEDNAVHLFNLLTGEIIAPARRFSDSAYTVTFSPDGQRLFVSSHNDKEAVIWKYRKDRVDLLPAPATGIHSMTFTADGRRFLTWTWDSPLHVWEAESLRPISPPINVGLHAAFALSHDGRRAVSKSQNGTAILIDLEHPRVLLEPIEHEGGIESVMFSSDDARVLTGSVDGTARVWDARMRTPESKPLPRSSGGGTAVFDHVGKKVLASVERNGLQVFDERSGESVSPVLRHPAADAHIRYGFFSEDDSRLLTTGEEGFVRVWDVASFEPRLDLAVGNSAMLAKFSPDGRFIVAADRAGFATLWNAQTGERLAAMDHRGNEVIDFAFDPRGGYLRTSAQGGVVRCWTLPGGNPAGVTLRHRAIVWSVSYSPNGKRVVTGSGDQTAQVWDSRTGAPIGKALRHSKDVYLAIFSPDGERVLTTSEDGTARVWNAQTGEPVSPYLRHGARIWRGAFSPDGRMVATGSDDRMVRLWDPESGLPMSGPLQHSDSVGRLAFSQDGHRLLSFGGQVRLWDVTEAQIPVPMWFCDLVEELVGFRRREDGQLLPVGPEAISNVRELARAGLNSDFYSRWAQWFLIERMQESPPMFRPE